MSVRLTATSHVVHNRWLCGRCGDIVGLITTCTVYAARYGHLRVVGAAHLNACMCMPVMWQYMAQRMQRGPCFAWHASLPVA